jgi:hypothetical protein|tara:strand:- start:702 stop:947 length:246 start_codon:yes stop_codon:yes gene_type:complete
MTNEYKQVFKYGELDKYDTLGPMKIDENSSWMLTIGPGGEKTTIIKPDQYVNLDGILCWEDNDQPVVSALHKDSKQLEFDF